MLNLILTQALIHFIGLCWISLNNLVAQAILFSAHSAEPSLPVINLGALSLQTNPLQLVKSSGYVASHRALVLQPLVVATDSQLFSALPPGGTKAPVLCHPVCGFSKGNLYSRSCESGSRPSVQSWSCSRREVAALLCTHFREAQVIYLHQWTRPIGPVAKEALASDTPSVGSRLTSGLASLGGPFLPGRSSDMAP